MSSQIVVTPDPLALFRQSSDTLKKSIDVLIVDLQFNPFEGDAELAWEDKWRAIEALALKTVKVDGFLITRVQCHALELMLDIFQLRWNQEHYVKLYSGIDYSTASHQVHIHEFFFVWFRSGKCDTPRCSVITADGYRELTAAFAKDGDFVVELFGDSQQWVSLSCNYLGVKVG